jgi:hypothetical protein
VRGIGRAKPGFMKLEKIEDFDVWKKAEACDAVRVQKQGDEVAGMITGLIKHL